MKERGGREKDVYIHVWILLGVCNVFMGDWRRVEGVLWLMVMCVEKYEHDHDVLLVQVLLVLMSKNAGTLRKGMPVYNL